ncbi:hypothetical protein OIU78_009409 [Salix suchowensis]|nr:hypothetical protein OIU78_009409 [Salix suchowensis]
MWMSTSIFYISCSKIIRVKYSSYKPTINPRRAREKRKGHGRRLENHMKHGLSSPSNTADRWIMDGKMFSRNCDVSHAPLSSSYRIKNTLPYLSTTSGCRV